MAYTEINKRNGIRYYYRTRTIRNGKKFRKERIYLGKNLAEKILILKESEADKKLNIEKERKRLRMLNKIIPKIRRILEEHNIKKAGLFGSYARGEQKKNSDIDILIQPVRGMGLEFVGVKLELEEKLGKKVDLVTYKYIHPQLKNQILKEEIRII